MSAHLAGASGLAFERLAPGYDNIFTNSLVGRAQRDVVWQTADKLFKSGDRVLELNCGTGEDAMHLASRGVTVRAYDASPGMVAVARERIKNCEASSDVSVELLAIEDINRLRGQVFDGVFSNFSGLNCVENLQAVAGDLLRLLRPGGIALLCLSSPICAFETVWFVMHGEFGKSVRRWSGKTIAKVESLQVPVWYPSVSSIEQSFSPWFQLRDVTAVGLFIPPSYAESWAARHPRTFKFLGSMDTALRQLPMLRVLGDHVLLTFERCA